MIIHRMLICTIALLIGSSVLAKDYEIRLDRPAKVGEKSEVIITGKRSRQMTMTSQGRVLRENKSSLSATFEGTITVLKVDKLQRESELKLLVAKCHKKVDGKTTEEEVLAKGTEVVLRQRDSDVEFLIDGKVVPKDIAEVLSLFFTLNDSQDTDDDLFGTKDRKKVGESWPVNSVKLARYFASKGVFKGGAKDITGSTKIEEEVVVGGTKCLRFICKAELGNFTPPLPPGMAVKKANMSVSVSYLYPVDTSVRHLSEKMAMTMELVAEGKATPEAPGVTLTVKGTGSKHMRRKFLK